MFSYQMAPPFRISIVTNGGFPWISNIVQSELSATMTRGDEFHHRDPKTRFGDESKPMESPGVHIVHPAQFAWDLRVYSTHKIWWNLLMLERATLLLKMWKPCLILLIRWSKASGINLKKSTGRLLSALQGGYQKVGRMRHFFNQQAEPMDGMGKPWKNIMENLPKNCESGPNIFWFPLFTIGTIGAITEHHGFRGPAP